MLKIMRIKQNRFLLSVALGILLSLTACDSSARKSSLELRDFDYQGNQTGTEKIFVAVSQQADFSGDFLTHGLIIDTLGPSSPLLDDIIWYANDNNAKSDRFWLLVAEDTNKDGSLSPGDWTLPAMAFELRDKYTTVLKDLVFNWEFTVPFSPDRRRFDLNIFFSDPALISKDKPLHIVVGPGPDLTIASPDIYHFRFANYELAKNLVLQLPWAAEYFGYAWWSPSGNSAIMPGDWISHPPNEAAKLDELPNKTLILSPLRKY